VNIDWKIIRQCFNVSNKAEHCCGRWRTGRELRHEWNDMYPEYAELIKQGRIAEVPPEFEFESQMKRLKAKGTRRKLRDDNEGENAEDIERELKKLRQEEEDSNADDERDEEEVSAGRSKRKRDHNDDSHGSGKKPKVSFFEADCDDNNARGPTKRKANSFTIEESEDNGIQGLSKKPKTTNFLEHDTTDYLPWEEEATPFIIQDE
jgi:hypothetical protein